MHTKRLTLAVAAVALGGAMTARTPGQVPGTPPVPPPATPVAPAPATRPTALPTTSPFDAYDPEIRAVNRLNWRNANFDALDLKTRSVALVALNQLLDVAGAKADARADMLVAYLDRNNLGAGYAAEAAAEEAAGRALTFEDAKKIAAAFIQTPEGRNQFAGEFDNSPRQMQAEYLELYEKTCRRKFDDVAEARVHVRAMARYLEKQNKLDDFLAWSAGEAQRRQKEHEAALARRAEEQAREAQQRRAEARATAAAEAERKRQAEHELALRRLDYEYQLEQAGIDADRRRRDRYDDDYHNWGWGYQSGSQYYYSGDTYRESVRNRINDSYNRWNPNRPPPGVWKRRTVQQAPKQSPHATPDLANPQPAQPQRPPPPQQGQPKQAAPGGRK